MSELPLAAATADSTSSAGSAGAATPTGRLGRLRSAPFLRPLADRDYRLFWGGESISVLGDQFHFVALAWLVLQLTGSGLALGTVLTAAAIPRVILPPGRRRHRRSHRTQDAHLPFERTARTRGRCRGCADHQRTGRDLAARHHGRGLRGRRCLLLPGRLDVPAVARPERATGRRKRPVPGHEPAARTRSDPPSRASRSRSSGHRSRSSSTRPASPSPPSPSRSCMADCGLR